MSTQIALNPTGKQKDVIQRHSVVDDKQTDEELIFILNKSDSKQL